MIELKQYNEALTKADNLIKLFDDSQIDFKAKARI